MLINNKHNCQISFERRHFSYPRHIRNKIKDIKQAALEQEWVDIYTGERFSKRFKPSSIEHIIPFSERLTNRVKAMTQKGFDIINIENLIPVNSKANHSRGNKSFRQTVLEEPQVLKRLISEIDNNYSIYQSNCVNGKQWVKGLQRTLAAELEGLASCIKTRNIIDTLK